MQDIQLDVLRKASEGDLKSFEVIYRAYTDYVFNVALRIVRQREDAQEVVQEVFLTVYHHLKDFRFQSSLKTWIYRIAINMAINRAKKEAKTRNKTVEYDDTLNASDAKNAVSENIEREANEGTINKLLEVLTPEQKVCVILRNIDGLSYQEIALALNVDINVVRSRLKRAREKLLSMRNEVMAHEM